MIEIGRVLVVDDSAMMRMVLRKSLDMAKVHALEIVDATNGVEAMKMIQEGKFDLMFCDLNMPGMNGDELLERLSKIKGVDIPPIVIVSSEATPQRIERLHCDRVIGVLRKPFTPELIAKLLAESKESYNKELAL